MADITSQNAAQAIVKLVAAQGLPPVIGNLVMGNLINREFEPTLANAGDTVNIPVPPFMQANDVNEGGSVTLQSPSLGNAQVVLNIHAESSFQIPDVTAALVGAERGDFSLMNKYLTPAMIAIATKIEQDILAYAQFLTANAAVGSLNVAPTESTVDLAETALFNALVPPAEQRHLVCSAASYAALRQIERFSEEKTVGTGAAISSGTVGQLKGFNVYRSQYVFNSSGSFNLAFAKDALAMVMRRLPAPLPGTGAVAEYAELGNFGMRIVLSYAPNTLAQQFTVDALYGINVLRPTFGVITYGN